MTSFIVASSNKDKRKEYITNYCQALQISAFDQTVIEKDSGVKQNVQSIGIEEIKNLQKKIFLKPLNSDTKAVIIDDAHLLTIEAQNALLKVLEEPPEHTIIILSSDSKEHLLPTIISRCQIIELEKNTKDVSEKEKSDYENFIEQLADLSIGDRLKQAELLAKDKNKAIEWVEKLIIVLREKLLLAYSSNETNIFYFSLLKSFQKLYTLLKTTNVNVRLAIENTLLNVLTS